MRIYLGLLIVLVTCRGSLAAEDPWRRIVCIDDPKLAVTLLLKPDASPADEDFVGWEFDNRTGTPIKVTNGRYALEHVLIVDRDTGKPLAAGSMASGNHFDLLCREGKPTEPQRATVIPVGVTRQMRKCSVYSLAITGFPKQGAWTLSGRATLEITFEDRTTLASPKEGLPFQFNMLAPDARALEAMSAQLKRVLAEPADPFADAYALSTLLKVSEVATTVDVHALLKGLSHGQRVGGSYICTYINQHHATDPATIDFWIDAIQRSDYHRLLEMVNAANVRSPRLIEPLIACIEHGEHYAPHFALRMLRYQRPVMPDRAAIAKRVGPMVLERMPQIKNGEFPDKERISQWSVDIADLALTDDPTAAKYIAAYLDRKDITIDATWSSMNDAVSTRACDEAYNALLTLLDRPDPQFQVHANEHAPAEYARRDKLIAELKKELASPTPATRR